jgi:hypothetical protein
MGHLFAEAKVFYLVPIAAAAESGYISNRPSSFIKTYVNRQLFKLRAVL